MLCQLVKVGSSYDMKVVVPDFKKAEYNKQKQIVLALKKYQREYSFKGRYFKFTNCEQTAY